MNRRGFFASLAGMALAPIASKPAAAALHSGGIVMAKGSARVGETCSELIMPLPRDISGNLIFRDRSLSVIDAILRKVEEEIASGGYDQAMGRPAQ